MQAAAVPLSDISLSCRIPSYLPLAYCLSFSAIHIFVLFFYDPPTLCQLRLTGRNDREIPTLPLHTIPALSL